jgi:PAS domain S-box-containing protein
MLVYMLDFPFYAIISFISLIMIVWIIVYRCSRYTKIIVNDELYRSLVEFCPEPILIHDGQSILYGNPAFVRALAAQNIESIAGKPVSSIIHPSCLDTLHRRKAEAEKYGKLEPTEYKINRYDGQIRDFEMSTIVLRNGAERVAPTICL